MPFKYIKINPMQSSFKFDRGNTNTLGWRVSNLMDESNKQYFHPGGYPVFGVQHWERSNYPDAVLASSQIDPTKLKGCLMVYPYAFELSLNDPGLGFPLNKKWHIDIASYSLSINVFNGTIGYTAGISDQITPGSQSCIKATIFLRGELNGTTIDVGEVVNGGFLFTPLKTLDSSLGKYDQISNKFNVPAGAKIRQIIIRLEGDYKLAYEGFICIDDVIPIKET